MPTIPSVCSRCFGISEPHVYGEGKLGGMLQQVGDDQPSTDAVFEALADEYRRTALCFFADSEGDLSSLQELSEQLAETLGLPVATVEVSLVHTHLPKLAQAGFVEYDARSGAVRARNSESVSEMCDGGLFDCPSWYGQ